MMIQNPLISGTNDINSSKKSSVTLQVPLIAFLFGFVDVHPNINPQEAQQSQPPLPRSKECLLRIQIQRSREEWLKLLSTKLLV